MREFVIDRSQWRCGGTNDSGCGFGPTSLLNDHGFMCCLGQIARQLGWGCENIKGCGCPSDVILSGKKVNKKILLSGFEEDSEFANVAMTINDDPKITQRTREKRLIALGKKHGLQIKFIGKAVKRHLYET